MSLEIGRHIAATLTADNALTEKIGNRSFPLSTIQSTSFPFVVYERESISPARTKDLYDDESVNVAVYAFSDKYAESVDVAQLCRKALSGSTGDYDSFSVADCQMIGAKEAYMDQTFVQKMTFELTTKEK